MQYGHTSRAKNIPDTESVYIDSDSLGGGQVAAVVGIVVEYMGGVVLMVVLWLLVECNDYAAAVTSRRRRLPSQQHLLRAHMVVVSTDFQFLSSSSTALMTLPIRPRRCLAVGSTCESLLTVIVVDSLHLSLLSYVVIVAPASSSHCYRVWWLRA